MYEQSLFRKIKYKEMKTVRVTDYTNQTPLSISYGKNVKV